MKEVAGLSEAAFRSLAAPLAEAVVSFCSQAKIIRVGDGLAWTMGAGGRGQGAGGRAPVGM